MNKYRVKVLSLTMGLLFLLPCLLFAQQTDTVPENAPQIADAPKKFALVIGNGNYTGLAPLTNPVNDANDIAAILQHLGFTVDKILNGNQDQMESAVSRLRDRLSESTNSYGFFFYAGHGVQSGGENFLIPVDANIPGENYLRNRAVSVQTLLDDLNDAGNSLNVIVLDACRDNPFGWSRSGSRGLSIVTRQPTDSIIVYATSAGARASDGDGRNGLFTSQLINNLATPGLEVKEIFNRTGSDVAVVSNRQQVPAIYNQFFGTAFLGDVPIDFEGYIVPSTTVILRGDGQDRQIDKARLWTLGASVGTSFTAPWLVGTAHGTIAPLKYTFIELGFDLGLVPGDRDVNYYSLYPFGHFAFFIPFTTSFGAYIGAGGGLMIVSYKFEGGTDYSENFGLMAFTAGFNILSMFDISFTLRTNFEGLSNKLSVGYVYRFK